MISIIIPVYNSSQYLNECIQSVVNQSYRDFECILIDDGSSDGSEIICDQWEHKDSRIKVIHQPNQGVSKARNKGITEAQGEYIAFIDSDDWIDSNYLNTLLRPIEESNVDLVVCGLQQHYSNETFKNYSYKTGIIHIERQDTKAFTDINKKFLLFGPVIKLYKRTIIQTHNIHFPPEYTYGEDLLFNYNYLEYVKAIYIIDQCLYHYRIIGNGTLSSIKRINQFEIDYAQWNILKDFFYRKNLWNDYSTSYLYHRLWWCMYDTILSFPERLKGKSIKYKIQYIKQIVSITEVKQLPQYIKDIHAPQWIKICICQRMYKLLWGLIELKHEISIISTWWKR